MIKQYFSSTVFHSLEELPEVLKDTKAETSRLLAEARMPAALLQTRAIGKFHVKDQDKPGFDSLAQLELVDVDNMDILNIYRDLLWTLGWGRISIVKKGGMTYNLADSINAFIQLVAIADGIEAFVKNEENMGSIGTWAKQLFTFQKHINKLSDLREQNGFSLFENQTYSSLVMACYALSETIQGNFDIPQATGVSESAYLIARLAQHLDTERLKNEFNSPNGINRSVYFSPRIEPEDAEFVI